jgi:hypothetical protein
VAITVSLPDLPSIRRRDRNTDYQPMFFKKIKEELSNNPEILVKKANTPSRTDSLLSNNSALQGDMECGKKNQP